MLQKDFEIRFDQARVRLNNSLKELEKVITEKLLTSNDAELRSTGAGEQAGIIQNLSDELNKLQNTLAEIGDENEVLAAENKSLLSNLNKFSSQGSTLVEAIESDLVRIEEIIKNN